MKLNLSATEMLATGIGTVALAFILLFVLWESPFVYHKRQGLMVWRVLSSNPEDLLDAGRQLLKEHHGSVGEVSPSSSTVPKVLRNLSPSRIRVSTNSIAIDFSDLFNPFGIVVFPFGEVGRGPHKWIDGLWLYDDGQLEPLRKNGSMTNGGRVLRLETNRIQKVTVPQQ